MTSRESTVGIVLLDDEGSIEGDSRDPADRRKMASPWTLTDPEAWDARIVTTIAKGVDSDGVLNGLGSTAEAVTAAVQRLQGIADVVIGGCGFFWRPAHGPMAAHATSVPTMLTVLDYLDFGGSVVGDTVGIVTYSPTSLSRLLSGHPLEASTRVVGLCDLPDWEAIGPTDYMTRGGWSMAGLEGQLLGRLESALQDGGELDGISSLLLECTALPNFRQGIRDLTTVPMYDVVQYATSALG